MLSQASADRIAQATRDACFEFVAVARSEGRLPDRKRSRYISSAISEIVGDVISEFWNQRNFGHLLQLPTELLALIAHELKLADRISMSKVCKTLHRTVWHTPTLWTAISHSDTTPVGRVTSLLQLSVGLPVSLDVVLDENSWEEITQCIVNSLMRCTSLKVEVHNNLPEAALDAFSSSLHSPAPLLHTLLVFDTLGVWEPSVKHPISVLFRGQSPRLRRIKLNMLSVKYSELANSGLSLPNVQHGLFSQTERITAFNVFYMLQPFPGLVELAIELLDRGEVDAWMDQIPLPPTLRELIFLVSHKSADVTMPLYCMSHMSLDRITAVYTAAPSSRSSYVAALQLFGSSIGTVRTLRIGSSSVRTEDGQKRPMDLYLSPEAGPHDLANGALANLVRQRALVSIDMRTLERLDHTLFAGLKDLVLHECMMLELPPLPQLLRLTVYLARWNQPFYRREGHNSVFFPPEPAARPLVCPQLRTLTIFHQDGTSATPWLAPEMIRGVVERRLRFRAPRLPQLVMLGVRLLESNLGEVMRLWTAVDDIQYVSIPPRNLTPAFSDLLSWN
ncbi:hypothetical protein BKA62DRAFT_697593 [Auriculariales sp. MPI-PUGE-AT-0066]|nr:hypothetical protein BKA62DRAFT_697593 [Auriculariales sp. MPI-PUGE-AT-0066]